MPSIASVAGFSSHGAKPSITSPRCAKTSHTPLLLIVSDADTRIPMHNGLTLFAAAPNPKTLITLHGFQHNDLYKNPTDTWWQPTLTFLQAPKPPQMSTPSQPTSELTPTPTAAP